MHCYKCGKALQIDSPVGRRDLCPHCESDLRCCLNCALHDPSYAGACREPQAERTTDKDRANFCDFFVFRMQSKASEQETRGDEAKKKLESLFKK